MDADLDKCNGFKRLLDLSTSGAAMAELGAREIMRRSKTDCEGRDRAYNLDKV